MRENEREREVRSKAMPKGDVEGYVITSTCWYQYYLVQVPERPIEKEDGYGKRCQTCQQDGRWSRHA
jgi:hypothetical protein